MILRSAPPSPFGRKVKIAAAILGLSDRITIVAADTNADEELAHAKSARKNSDAGARRRPHAVRFARDPGISRSSRRRRPHHSARARRALRGACACRPCATASWMPRSCRFTKRAIGPKRSAISPGSTMQAGKVDARARGAGSATARRSTRCRMSGRSRWPARSAIRICASRANGAARYPKLVAWLDASPAGAAFGRQGDGYRGDESGRREPRMASLPGLTRQSLSRNEGLVSPGCTPSSDRLKIRTGS